MTWVQDIFQYFDKFRFWEIVREYQQGLHFRKGIVIGRCIKYHGKELENIVADEKEVMDDNGGKLKYLMPFSRPDVPEDYRRSFWTGLLKGPKRRVKDKRLRAGLYFYIPFIDDIVTEDVQERVIDLQNLSVPTDDDGKDSNEMFVSCALRYEINDFYKAHTAVHDYESTLQDHTIAVLSEHSRNHKYDEWKDPEVIYKIQDNVLKALRETATRKWGLKIHKFYITDHVRCKVYRLAHEGENSHAAPVPEEEE
ncbi:hypothetical protein KY349_02450 [Candidatus Woesearchaeota archaeon]|jgi:regulator of protease activity HflC (stomatin/prohibitin superfamily)|nr:hypothetical protein [Candidatus Woesearchaeota archaeon]